MEALESVAVGELLSKFTAAAVVGAALGITLKHCSTTTVQQEGSELCDCVQQLGKGGKWVVSMKPNPPRSSSTFAAWQYIPTPKLGFCP